MLFLKSTLKYFFNDIGTRAAHLSFLTHSMIFWKVIIRRKMFDNYLLYIKTLSLKKECRIINFSLNFIEGRICPSSNHLTNLFTQNLRFLFSLLFQIYLNCHSSWHTLYKCKRNVRSGIMTRQPEFESLIKKRNDFYSAILKLYTSRYNLRDAILRCSTCRPLAREPHTLISIPIVRVLWANYYFSYLPL